jgi:hypothetical protein
VSIPNGTARCTAAGTRLRAWPTPMGPTTRAGIRPVIPDDRRRGRSCPLGFPSRPAHPSHDRIGRPLHPRASGAHTTGPISPAVPSSVQALSPRSHLPSPGAVCYGASSRVHSRSPARLPLTRSLPWMGRGPWASSPGFAPRRQDLRHTLASPRRDWDVDDTPDVGRIVEPARQRCRTAQNRIRRYRDGGCQEQRKREGGVHLTGEEVTPHSGGLSWTNERTSSPYLQIWVRRSPWRSR